MAYDIRLVKLVSGELVLGKYNAETKTLNDVAIMQTVPMEGGMQLAMLPYGYPFDQKYDGKISEEHFLFQYAKTPEDIQSKYLEIISGLVTPAGGLSGSSGLIM